MVWPGYQGREGATGTWRLFLFLPFMYRLDPLAHIFVADDGPHNFLSLREKCFLHIAQPRFMT
jgi:hypothetical protein